MNVHDAIHELNIVFVAGVDHGFELSTIASTWFFAHDMLACLGGFGDPLFAHSSGKRNIDRINVISCKEVFITFDGDRLFLEGA